MLYLGCAMPIVNQKTRFGSLRGLALGKDSKFRQSRGMILPVPANDSSRHYHGLHPELHLGLTRSNRLRINHSSRADNEIYLILTCRPDLFSHKEGSGTISVPSTQPIHLIDTASRNDKWYDAILRGEPGDIFRVSIRSSGRLRSCYYLVGEDDVLQGNESDYEDIYLALCHELGIKPQRSHIVTSEGTWREVTVATPEPLASISGPRF